MYVPKRLITVEGHPEYTEDIVREILESRKESGIFDVEIYKDAIGRVGKRQDGVEVACGFLRFLLEE